MTMFKPNHLSQRAPFFSLIIFYLFMLPSLQHCQQIIPEDRDPPQYTPCNQPFNCGNISNISYPFWAGSSNRPQECGRSGFELTNCENSTQLPRIKIKDLNFYVSNINNSQLEPPLTITIARSDLWDSPCTDLLVNTTLDSTRFSYVQPVRNLTLYYGCLPQNDDYAMIHRFMCKFKDKNVSYYGDDSVSRVVNRTSSCSTKIRVPISGDGFDFIVSENATEAVEKLLRQGIQIKYSAQWDLCRSCLKSNGICGSNSSTDSFLCFCRDRPYSSTCPTTPTPSEHRHFLIGAVGILVFFCMFCGVKLSIFDGNDETNNEDVEAFIQKIGPLAVKRYKFLDVIKMTYSFKDKLGQGGYGDVYKGKLLNDGCAVAVKVLKESRGNGEDFVNEVASMSRTSHVNVATLLGYCFEGRNKALVYEFMPNGSLEKFIYKERNPTANTPRLELEILFQIAIGIARGLEYLHRGCNAKILHFDIKPHNILLDENFCPKISDFGLSKLCTRKESYISMLEARGTVGYIAPEVFCRNFGGVSAKSDVYSYGMMILEMVGGRKNVDARVSHTSEIYFPDWVYEQLEQGSDCRLLNAETENTKEVSKKMILVGLWCIQTRPSDRPSMTKVIDMLEGSNEALQMPPKPLLSAPSESSPESCTISILC